LEKELRHLFLFTSIHKAKEKNRYLVFSITFLK